MIGSHLASRDGAKEAVDAILERPELKTVVTIFCDEGAQYMSEQFRDGEVDPNGKRI